MEKTYQLVPDEEKQPLWKGLRQSPIKTVRLDPESRLWRILGLVVPVLLFVTSLILFAASYWLRYGHPSDLYFTRLYSPYSPAEEIVEYTTVRYNVTPELKKTEYVGYGPEVDKAWDHITYDVGDQMITPKALHRLGLDPNSLRIKDPRTGEEGYRVGIQVFHQLHCLNLLRQDSYREYYSHQGGDIEVEPEDLRGHLDHCLEILRISLMCQSDIGVYAFKYYEGYDGHWPDFSTLHTCRNFDAIRDWAFENAVVFGDEE
ncbi:hypothetical protein B0I35DRAFT_159170 [Stachybotrys elegans]|uniref:Cyclochlorotine biosynthesis protein O n=1 Tax=Stachybotrys elegans TaxID=80388 RepID=A0A8K0WVC5_9HYPO|nr:hypothetical protein B0I35DRAFT_159170 [Stachybotrys elegans]